MVLCLVSPAAAQEVFDGADWGGSIAAGTAGAALGGLAAAAIGAASVEEEDDLYGLEETAAALIALPLGVDLGASGAVFAYGELSGHDGSFLATLAGGTVGTLVGVGLLAGVAAIDDDLWWLGTIGLLVSPAVGATVGYRLSLAEGAAPAPSGALLDHHPAVGLRLSVPAVVAAVSQDGVAVGVPLVGGRF